MDDATLDTLARQLRQIRPEGPTEASYRPGSGSQSSQPAWDPAAQGFLPVGLLGQGGMGEVYKAHQASLDREVALKKARSALPLAGMHLTLEALANGRLEHPNIVPIYELTASGDGPAIAMKLVSGKSWKALLHEEHSLFSQLEILIKVCDAVAFAHSKNISHNDLKPSNVMVGAFGEVLLMDWGLATEIGPLDTRSRLRHKSHVQGCCGTPCYMAPELARGDGAQLGEWTDIYLLGGILFRILCGRPPHGGSLEEALASAMSPHPPVLPVAVVADTPLLAAACTRALQPEPGARFRAVADFQKALRAHLEHRESLAVARRAAEQLADCQSRAAQAGEEHRLRLYEDYAQAVAGFVAARQLWAENASAGEGERGAREAYARAALGNGDLGLARAQLERLQSQGAEALELQQSVTRARARAAHERRARGRLRFMLASALVVIVLGLSVGLVWMQMANAQIAGQGRIIEGKRRLAARAADVAFDVLENMSSEATYILDNELGDPNVRRVRKEILAGTAEGWRALALALTAEDSSALTTARARRQYGLSLVEADKSAEGLRELQAAIAALAGATEPAAVQQRVLALTQSARSLLVIGKPHAAAVEEAWTANEAVYSDLPVRVVNELAMEWERIGFELERRAQLSAARQALQRALLLREALPSAASPGLLIQLLIRLAQLDNSGGDYARSAVSIARAVETAEQAVQNAAEQDAGELRTILVLALSDASDLHYNQGQVERALELSRRASEVGLARLAENPEDIRSQRVLAEAQGDLGRLFYRTASPVQAEQAFEQARILREPLVRRFPDDARLVFGLSDTLENLAQLAVERGAPKRAESLLVRCCELRVHLVNAGNNPARRNELYAARAALAGLWADSGRFESAEAGLRDVIASFQRLVLEAPEVRLNTLDLVDAQLRLVRVLEVRRQLGEAADLCQDGLTRLRALAEEEGSSVELRLRIARVLLQSAGIAVAGGALEVGRGFYAEALLELRTALQREPLLVAVRKDLAICLDRLGQLWRSAGDLEQARACLQEAIEQHQSLLQTAPHLFDPQEVQNSASRLAQLHGPADALPYLALAREMGQQRVSRQPDDLSLQVELSSLLVEEGTLLMDTGSAAAARDRLAEALVYAQAVFDARPQSINAGSHVVTVRYNLFVVHYGAGATTRALEHLTAARDAQQQLVALSPSQQPQLDELAGLMREVRGQYQLQDLLGADTPVALVTARGLYDQQAYQEALDGLEPALEAEGPASLQLMAALLAARAALQEGAARGTLELRAFAYLTRFFELRSAELEAQPEPAAQEAHQALRWFLRHRYASFAGLRARPGFGALFGE